MVDLPHKKMVTEHKSSDVVAAFLYLGDPTYFGKTSKNEKQAKNEKEALLRKRWQNLFLKTSQMDAKRLNTLKTEEIQLKDSIKNSLR